MSETNTGFQGDDGCEEVTSFGVSDDPAPAVKSTTTPAVKSTTTPATQTKDAVPNGEQHTTGETSSGKHDDDDKPRTSPDDVVPVIDEQEPEGDEVDKKKKKEAKKRVNIFQLYRYAESVDYLCIIIGLLCGVCQGFSMQLPFVLVGNIITDYTKEITKCSNLTAYNNQSMAECTSEMLLTASLQVTIVFAVCGAVCCLGSYGHVALFTIVADRVTRSVRRLAFSNILRQHIGYFDIHFGGELNTRLTQDVTKFEVGIGSKVSLTVAWLMTFLFGMILCLIKGWQLTLIMCAMLPVAAILSGITGRVMKVFTEREMTAYAKAGGVAEEALANIRIVAAFAGEKKEAYRYDSLLKEARKISLKSAIASSFGVGIPFFLMLFVTAITIYCSGVLVKNGDIEPGFVMQLFSSMMIGLRSLGYAAGALEVVSDSQGAAYGIYEIITAKTQIDSTDPSGEKPAEVKGLIRFENIHFVYPARANVQVLKGLTLDIQPGQSAALVGPSGCGKSTTIQLIQRFYDPDSGNVYLDGRDVRSLNLAWLRRQIGVVSQEPVLFAASIEDNIRFGNPDATIQEIMAAAKEADAHHFINKLPEKYSTVLNEQGTQLSRGEKQRISLARALVRQPKILLLDECTSALDNESEAAVQAALDKARKGRTTIIIAHRLSTVRDCDVLFCVDKGVVAEYGTHTELLARKELYHKLVSTQMLEEKEKVQKAKNLEKTPLDITMQIERLRASSVASKRRMSTISIMTTGSQTRGNEEVMEKIKLAQGDLEPDVPLAKYPLRRIFELNKPEWPCLIVGVLGGFAVGAIWPTFSILFGNVIGAITNPNLDELMAEVTAMTWGIFGLSIVSAVITGVSVFLLRYAGEYLTMRVRSLAYRAMLRQELSWFDSPQHQVGSLTSRLANEASRIKMATGNTLLFFAAAISAIILAIVIALVSGWQLGLAILPLMPLTILSGIIQGYMNTSYEMKSHLRTEESGRVASEAVDKIRTLAALTKEFYFLDKYMDFFDQMKKEAKKRANIIGGSWAFYYFDSYLINIVAFGFGLWLVSQSMIEFEMIFRILIVSLMTCTDVGRANANIPEITSSKAAAYKILQLLDRIPEIDPQDPTGQKPEACNGEVGINGVTFYYPTRPETLVLRDLTITAKRGQCIAIVGPSGGGKSTVVQLIERFYDVFAGIVTVDGVDIKDLNIQWLRSQMGIVTQEPILFAVSLAENIAYGDNSRKVSTEEVIEAAKAANIHGFISSLPDGYKTNVGSKGTQLSGGQKQRVSIARALVRNPKILLLDDATSALDSHSESIVEEALDKARSGRTSIVISHRLSSIIGADCILYMDRGKVLERGSHGELMAKKQHYYQLQQANQGRK